MESDAMNFDFGSLTNKKWVPEDAATWKINNIQDNFDNLKVLDGIYQSTEKKIDRVIK